MKISCTPAFLSRGLLMLLAAVLLAGSVPAPASRVSRFGVRRPPDRRPAEFRFDEIWFEDEEGARRIPEIDPRWVAAAFDEGLLADRAASLSYGLRVDTGHLILQRAKEIEEETEAIVGVYYDRNLVEDGCFFELQEGLGRTGIKEIVELLNRQEGIAYAHPTLKWEDGTAAYFDAFRMRWKTGIEEEVRDRLLEQAHVSYDPSDAVYRVDLFSLSFFRALHLLAEDIRVLEAVPCLVPLERTIEASVSIPLHGAGIGDRIPFSLRIAFSDRVQIDPSSLVNLNLRPRGIQRELADVEFDPYDYVKAVERSPIRITGWMKLYAPGEFLVPPVEIHYRCTACSEEDVRTYKTAPIPLRIASIVPGKGEKAKLVVPTDPVFPRYPVKSLEKRSRSVLRRAFLCLAAAAVLLGWCVARGLRARRGGEREDAEKARHEARLEERLRGLLGREPEAPCWRHVLEVTRTLREYLVVRYGLRVSPYRGSGEVFSEAVGGRLPQEVASRLRDVLLKADRVVAAEEEGPGDWDEWRREVEALVREVRSRDLESI